MDQVTDDMSRFRFRYIGLVLLVRSGDEFVLMPRGITATSDRPVFVVPKDGVRVDLGTRRSVP
ncbi:hypothetical protein [Actinokineospora cianjurensis]|uniref:Uncharacterized protein n=1 Tax=Actinokineospora cianjurensis TaxID=585224 RepID=A0A421AV43_9PSEU|nr:hypothetical protein [Actinokineospora cianjurensis]RLK53959.1 hypothetical protein CLV68_6341 [Actinokineospora cianjurensis]